MWFPSRVSFKTILVTFRLTSKKDFNSRDTLYWYYGTTCPPLPPSWPNGGTSPPAKHSVAMKHMLRKIVFSVLYISASAASTSPANPARGRGHGDEPTRTILVICF